MTEISTLWPLITRKNQGTESVQAQRYGNGRISLSLHSGEAVTSTSLLRVLTVDVPEIAVKDKDADLLLDPGISQDMVSILIESRLISRKSMSLDIPLAIQCSLTDKGILWVTKNAPRLALELLDRIGMSTKEIRGSIKT